MNTGLNTGFTELHGGHRVARGHRVENNLFPSVSGPVISIVNRQIVNRIGFCV
jgi:hypothetical protein